MFSQDSLPALSANPSIENPIKPVKTSILWETPSVPDRSDFTE